ncbi:hypothetical protein F5Y10DRAFT_285268 [Nemania abortiva]|nr:hypothetical protein F5Y10DRAFT_285268 [Nemania abortiva]
MTTKDEGISIELASQLWREASAQIDSSNGVIKLHDSILDLLGDRGKRYFLWHCRSANSLYLCVIYSLMHISPSRFFCSSGLSGNANTTHSLLLAKPAEFILDDAHPGRLYLGNPDDLQKKLDSVIVRNPFHEFPVLYRRGSKKPTGPLLG